MSEQGLKAALEAAVPGLCVTDSDRPCPVQVRGTIDGYRFYFRAWDGWAFAVSDRKQINPSRVLYEGLSGWKHEEPTGGGDDAGDMPDADVITCISGAVMFWRAHRAHGGTRELPAKPHVSRKTGEPGQRTYEAHVAAAQAKRYTPWNGLHKRVQDIWIRLEHAIEGPLLAEIERLSEQLRIAKEAIHDLEGRSNDHTKTK